MTNLDQSSALEAFVKRLMAEKYSADLDPELAQQIQADLLHQAEERIKAAIFASIPADKLDEFDRLLDGQDDETVQQFVAEAVPDLAEVTAQALFELRASYLS